MLHHHPSTQIQFDFTEEEKKPLPVAENLSWIEVAKEAPYFITDNGDNWTPIGQNDAIIWPDLSGAFRRKDLHRVEAYFKMLVQHGVTCLRLMLEYCQTEHRYFEKPEGRFQPNMIQLWDDIFALCEKLGLRILLTPFDTYWMWRRWSHHPYKKSNGGSCATRTQWLLCPNKRLVIKRRFEFVIQRWGNSGVLFGWDLWNEIHPAHAGGSASNFSEFIADLSHFVRSKEIELHGRAHLQTVSAYSTTLEKDKHIAECIFQHPQLDFASLHFYERKTIDSPKNTIDAAISTGRLTRDALQQIKDNRPFLDTEHGPIHTFNNRRKTLAAPFDDAYFRHMQWAHLASGGAGGGMRWPYRHPHTLTPGMRKAQRALSLFLPLIHWKKFKRTNWNNEVILSSNKLASFCCGDENQAVLWLLCKSKLDRKGLLDKSNKEVKGVATLPLIRSGTFKITAFDTLTGEVQSILTIIKNDEKHLTFSLPPIITDLAFAITRLADN